MPSGLKKGIRPLMNSVRVVLRNGASFQLATTMRRSGPVFLQHDTTTNPVYTGESTGLSLEDARMQRLMSKYEGFYDEAEGAHIATNVQAPKAAPAAAAAAAGKKGKKK